MQAYTAAEELGPQDKWTCPGCKQAVQAKLKLDLWSAPEVLIIHLKRFIHQSILSTICQKNDDPVIFPLQVRQPNSVPDLSSGALQGASSKCMYFITIATSAFTM